LIAIVREIHTEVCSFQSPLRDQKVVSVSDAVGVGNHTFAMNP